MSRGEVDDGIIDKPESIGRAILDGGDLIHLAGESSNGLIANVWARVATNGVAVICKNTVVLVVATTDTYPTAPLLQIS